MTITPPTVTQQTASAQAYSQAHHRWIWCPEAPAGGEYVGTKTELWAYDGIATPTIRLRSRAVVPSYSGEVGADATGRLVVAIGLSATPKTIPVPGDLLYISTETAPDAVGEIGMDALGRIVVYASGAAETVPTLTPDGGYYVWLVNKTGANSVKGTLVVASTITDSAFALAGVGADDCLGVVYDAGVADGGLCRVVISGIAEVLIEAGDTIDRRRWLRSPTATAGRGSLGAVAGGGSVAEHFKECGHCLVTKTNTDPTLAKCIVHFN